MVLMRLSWLIPQETKFFDMLEIEAEAVLKGAQLLFNLLNDFKDVEKMKNMITEVERQTDDLVHGIFEKLNQTFITPIDREDISSLASSLDNVLDHIHGAARRIHLYEIEQPTKTMVEFATVLLKACTELNFAVKDMKELKKPEKIEEICVEVNSLENKADEILNNGVVELFKTKDAKEIIKLKEIYEFLESAVDRCEDAANVISDIVMKNR
jgi:predicted phosphate transport protein (TIGR00153 family)